MALIARDLGNLEGNVLLFGGPYSNVQALKALRLRAEALNIPIARQICTGDIVAYGADPLACCDLMVGQAVVAGNCERQIANGAADCGCGFEDGSACDLASGRWFAHASGALSGTQHPAWFATLPDIITFTHCEKRYAVLHGGVTEIARFLWPTSPEAAFADELRLLRDTVGGVDAVVAGHCGVAFQRRVGDVDWINAGVIGMPPHDGRAQTRFVVLSDAGAMIHRLSYDHHRAAQAMTKAGLTQGYEQALITGHWPALDVLPQEMR